ncbi:MAG: AAA family ATPase [Anaerolineales bacterium]|nr:AAA family ATPase [Anaerolineales bacterium]
MFDILLPTKLYIPPNRPDGVERSRLLEKLAVKPQTKLILVSAPAGYGKTTLVTTWLSQLEGTEKCWLSLDEDDNELQQFFRYLTSTIRPLPNSGSQLSQLLQSNQPFPAKILVKTFVHDVTSVTTPFILVLDDYHAIDSVEVDNALADLLDLMPPQMTLVMTSRSDPGFPISRLRARGQLSELRADDLRFTEAEAAQFLQQTMGLTLLPSQIAALENRTEGWIAGLQMAALSMQNRASSDLDEFVRNFTGSHRFVLDYLVEETLLQQPENVRSFLLLTSILDHLCGPLCDAVVERDDSQAVLETLERDNLFVVPLDDKRIWYRYHHLFIDVLRAHAKALPPDQITNLHQRASAWFAQFGSPVEAFHHALAAEDYEQAAALAERVWRSMDRRYQSGIWLSWVKALPDEVVRVRPVLSAEYAWALLDSGEMEAAEVRLQDAERCLELDGQLPDLPSEMVVVSEAEFRALPTTIANARAYLAQALGDVPATVEYAQRALALPFDGDYFGRGLSALLLGFAYWGSGDLESARQAVSDAVSDMWAAENIPFVISFTSYLADIMLAQGCLHEAIRTYEHTLERTMEQSELKVPETAVLHLGLSELYLELDDMNAAASHLLHSEELGELIAFPPWYRHWSRAQARLKTTQGDLDGALEILNEAKRLYFRHPVPDVRPVAALRARVWILQGNLTDALDWAHAQGLSTANDLSYLREFEHITFARLLIARYRSDQDNMVIHEAVDLLTQLLQAAEAGNRVGSIIEILLLQALAHTAQDNIPAALASLERALSLAAPEGYIRLFVDEGPPMAALLQKIKDKDSRIKPYAASLLSAFPAQDVQPSSVHAQSLIDPLSDRELEILTLVTSGLKNQEIADQLVISLNTVLYHTKNIYSKLGVNKRALAIAKARELNLVK